MLYYLARNSLSFYHLNMLFFSRQIQTTSSSDSEQVKEENKKNKVIMYFVIEIYNKS